MKNARPDGLAELATAFLIGAGLGVTATMLIRPVRLSPRRRRLLRRIADRQTMVRDLRAVLASIVDR